MVGLGAILIALSAGLGKALGPRASEDDLNDEYCDRLEPLEDETDTLRDLFLEGPDEGWSPCQLRFRQARLRAEDAVKEMREVTRHPNFPLALKKFRGMPQCHGRKSRGNPQFRFNQALYYIRDYDELFRDWECPMVWTQDQG